MKEHQLIINKTKISAFDDFNGLYSDNAINICPLLENFQINIVYVSDAKDLDYMDLKPNDPMGTYIEKIGPLADLTYAEILVNEAILNKLCLTEQELLAAIAHEIGHVIFFFWENKLLSKDGLLEEMFCDEYACDMGLGTPLQSLLNKMINSGLYPIGHTQYHISRLSHITNYVTYNKL